MVIPLTLSPVSGLAQRLGTAISSLGVQAEKTNPGSQMQKLKKAAQEFEGVLLSTWLEEMQRGSLDSSGTAQGAGAETLRSLGTQAVAQALAQRGGLGIARMIVHHFRNAVGGAGGPPATFPH